MTRTPEEVLKPFQDQIRHEDALFNQRITWLMTFQGFLIIPFLIIENSQKVTQLEPIQGIIVSIGVLSAFLVFMGCWAAHQSINYLINSARIELDKIGVNITDSKRLLMRNPRYIQIAGASPSLGSIILISMAWMFLLQNISNISLAHKGALIFIASTTTLFSLINILKIGCQEANPKQNVASDIRIEKIYAGMLLTIAIYLIITIAYIAILTLGSSSSQVLLLPIFIIGGLFGLGVLFMIFKTR